MRSSHQRRAVQRRELYLLFAAVALGLVVRLLYVLLTTHLRLAGDEPEYDFEGLLIAHGKWWYTALPFGVLHAGAWKAPGYPLWLGVWYALLGHHVVAVRIVQALILGPTTIVLGWLLARRLFGPKVAALAVLVLAVYPFAFQYEELLYSESLATPLTLAVLLCVFTGERTVRRAAAAGALLGVVMLVRPTSVFLLAGAVAAWVTLVGWRAGARLSVVCAIAAVVVIAPWTIRNAVVEHGFLPISLQDAAAYGTFNPDAANDPVFPYAWRPVSPSTRSLFATPTTDLGLRARLEHFALRYIRGHPGSVPAAFFWNGLSRLWDIRRPSRALVEVPFEGRSHLLTEIGIYAYFPVLLLALAGLWRLRERKALWRGMIAIAIAASVLFTVDSGTRYRAPLEPLLVILACSAAAALSPRVGGSEAVLRWPRWR